MRAADRIARAAADCRPVQPAARFVCRSGLWLARGFDLVLVPGRGLVPVTFALRFATPAPAPAPDPCAMHDPDAPCGPEGCGAGPGEPCHPGCEWADLPLCPGD